MTVEQKLKLALGEQHFNLIVLSSQLEEAQKQLAELSKDKQPKPQTAATDS